MHERRRALGGYLPARRRDVEPLEIPGLDVFDAFFESISGFTTTGATVLRDFSLYDRPFYLWRSMTQWFGGLGVIALFISFAAFSLYGLARLLKPIDDS